MRDMIEQLEVSIVEDAINQDETCVDSDQTLLGDALKELEQRRHNLETYTKPLPVTPEMHSFLKDFYRSVFTQHKKRFFVMERHNYPVVDEFYEALCHNTDPSGILSGQNISLSKEEFWQRYEFRCGSIERIVNELRSQKDCHTTSTMNPLRPTVSSSGKPMSTTGSSPHSASSQPPVQEAREPDFEIPIPQPQNLETPSDAASSEADGEDFSGDVLVETLPNSEKRDNPAPAQAEREVSSSVTDPDTQIEEELYDVLEHELKDSESCDSVKEVDSSSQCETDLFVSCSAETEVTSPSKKLSTALRSSTDQLVYAALDHEELPDDIPATGEFSLGDGVNECTRVDSITNLAKMHSPRISEPSSVSEKEEVDWSNTTDTQDDDSDQVSLLTQNKVGANTSESISLPPGKALDEGTRSIPAAAWGIRREEGETTASTKSNQEKNALYYRDDDETLGGDYSDDCKCQGCIIL